MRQIGRRGWITLDEVRDAWAKWQPRATLEELLDVVQGIWTMPGSSTQWTPAPADRAWARAELIRRITAAGGRAEVGAVVVTVEGGSLSLSLSLR